MEEGHRGALRRRTVAGNAQQGNAAVEEIAVDERERELGQAAASGDRGVQEERERPAASNTCCICHEPWASSGGHRICCIPCGHVYGRSCLELWLARSRGRVAKCLLCGKRFRRADMINLYGATEHLLLDHCQQEQVATEEEEEEEEEEAPPAPDEQEQAAVAEEGGARQLGMALAPDQAAIMDVIAMARMNQGAAAAAAWNNGTMAWKDLEIAWRIEGDVDLGIRGAVAPTLSTRVILLFGAILLLFVVCVVLCFII